MLRHKNEIRSNINSNLKVNLNQLKLNKERKIALDGEIRKISMKLFHYLFSQQVNLLKQTANIETNLELNLNNIINKQNELLTKLESNSTPTQYDEIINDYNQLNNNSQTEFNFEFKKNEFIEKHLIIGHLLVIIFNILQFCI